MIRKITGATSATVVKATTTQAGIFKAGTTIQSGIQRLQNLSSILIPKVANKTGKTVDHLTYDPEGGGFRRLRDYLNLGDRTRFFINKSSQDIQSIADQILFYLVTGRVFTDAFSLSDVIRLTLNEGGITKRDFDDYVAVLESIIISRILAPFRDTVTATDARTKLFISKSFRDTTTMVDLAGVFDGITYNYGLQRTESILSAESLRSAAKYVRTARDGFADVLAETDRSTLLNFKPFRDSAVETDLIKFTALTNRADVTNATDVKAILAALRKTDSIAAGADTVKFSLLKYLADTAVMLDSTDLADRLTYDEFKRLQEFQTLADAKQLFVRKPLTDLSALSDVFNTFNIKAPADIFFQSDRLSFVSLLGKRDTQVIADLKSLLILKTAAPDAVTASDFVLRGLVSVKTFADIATLLDSGRSFWFNKRNTDTVTIADVRKFVATKRLAPDTTVAVDRDFLWLNRPLNSSNIAVFDDKIAEYIIKGLRDSVGVAEDQTELSDGFLFINVLSRVENQRIDEYLARRVTFFRRPDQGFADTVTESDRQFKLFGLDAKASVAYTVSSTTVQARDRDQLFTGTQNVSSIRIAGDSLENFSYLINARKYENILAGNSVAGIRRSGDTAENISFWAAKPLADNETISDRFIIGVIFLKTYQDSVAETELRYNWFNKSTKQGDQTSRANGNIFFYSEDFANTSGWTTAAGTFVSSNVIAAPNGTLTADKLIETSSTATNHYITNLNSGVYSTNVNSSMTASIYIKSAGQARYLLFTGAGIGASNETPIFNPDTGQVTTGATTTYIKSAYMYPVGSGWYRCVANYVSAGANLPFFSLTTSTTALNNPTYAGNGTSGLYIWGAQLTTMPVESHYVPSTSTAVYTTVNTSYDTDVVTAGTYHTGVRAAYDWLENLSIINLKSARASVDYLVSGTTVTAASGDRLFVGQQYGNIRLAGDPLERLSWLMLTNKTDTAPAVDYRTNWVNKTAKQGIDTVMQPGNVLTWSQNLTVSATSWTVRNGISAVSSTAAIAPDGTLTANKITMNGFPDPYIGQGPAISPSGKTVTSSIWAWVDAGQSTEFQMFLYDNTVTQVFATSITLTTTPTRYRFTATFPTSTSTGINIRFDPAQAPVTGSTIYVWGAQAEFSTLMGNYVPTTTAAITPYWNNTGASSDVVRAGAYVPGIRYSGDVLENVSIVKLQRATQGTGTVLARGNFSLYSEDQTLWAGGTSLRNTVSSNIAVAPNGSLTADGINFQGDGYRYQDFIPVTALPGQTWTFSTWAWTTSGTKIMGIRITNAADGNDSTFTSVTLTTTPTRYSVTRTFTGGVSPLSNAIQIGFDNRSIAGGDNTTGGIVVWGTQLEAAGVGSMSTYYPTTSTVYDIGRSNTANDNEEVYVGSPDSGIRAAGNYYENFRFWQNKLFGDATTIIDAFSFGDNLTYFANITEKDSFLIGNSVTGIRRSGDPLERLSIIDLKDAKSGLTFAVSGTTVTATDRDRLFVGQQYGTTRFSSDPLEKVAFLLQAGSVPFDDFPVVGAPLGLRTAGNALENTFFTILRAGSNSLSDAVVAGLAGYGIRVSGTNIENFDYIDLKSAKAGTAYTISGYRDSGTPNVTFTSVTVTAADIDRLITFDDIQAVFASGRIIADFVTIGTDAGFRLIGNNLETTKFFINKRIDDATPAIDLIGIGDGLSYTWLDQEFDTVVAGLPGFGIRVSGSASEKVSFIDLKDAKAGLTYAVSGTTVTATDRDRLFIGTQIAGTPRLSGDALERITLLDLKTAKAGLDTTVSGTTVTAADTDRLFVGQQYGNLRFSSDPLENTKFLLLRAGSNSLTDITPALENKQNWLTLTAKQGLTTLIGQGNWLGFSEAASSWTTINNTLNVVTSNNVTAPTGSLTADSITFLGNGYKYYDVDILRPLFGSTWTYSAWVWSTTGKASIGFRICDLTTGTDQAFTSVALTTTPTRVSITKTFNVAGAGNILEIGLDNRSGQGGDGVTGTVVIWGAQLEPMSVAGTYYPTAGTSYQVPNAYNNANSTDRLFIGSANTGIRAAGDVVENWSFWNNKLIGDTQTAGLVPYNLFTRPTDLSSALITAQLMSFVTTSNANMASPVGSNPLVVYNNSPTSGNLAFNSVTTVVPGKYYTLSFYMNATTSLSIGTNIAGSGNQMTYTSVGTWARVSWVGSGRAFGSATTIPVQLLFSGPYQASGAPFTMMLDGMQVIQYSSGGIISSIEPFQNRQRGYGSTSETVSLFMNSLKTDSLLVGNSVTGIRRSGDSLENLNWLMLKTTYRGVTSFSGNLITYSEDFGNAAWAPGATSGTVTTNTAETTDPLGGNTADILIISNTSNSTVITDRTAIWQTSVTIAAGETIRFSCYMKARTTSTNIELFTNTTAGAGNWGGNSFNLVTGLGVSSLGGGLGTIQAVGGGWYRCSTNVGQTKTAGVAKVGFSTGGSPADVYIWGAQVSVGSTLANYVQTTSAAITTQYIPATDPELITTADLFSITKILVRNLDVNNDVGVHLIIPDQTGGLDMQSYTADLGYFEFGYTGEHREFIA